MRNLEFELLKEALINNDVKSFKKITKADLHTHALLSSNRKIFHIFFPDRNLNKFDKNNNINSLSTFIKNNLLDISTTKEGQFKLFECTILTAINDGITILDTSIDYRLVYEVYNNDIKKFIWDLKKLKAKYIDKIVINYDLGISRNAYNCKHKKIIYSLIRSHIFNGIDLFGDELSKSVNIFKKIYKEAKRNNMTLKAHVGEFGTANNIYEAIRKLHLDVVQHGIAIVDSQKIMKYAKKKKIIFNVCPTSNLKLQRVNDIVEHPIKKMYDYGLIVTINTDDQLIFESSIFDEYLLLYDNNIFSIEELNQIRLNAFKN